MKKLFITAAALAALGAAVSVTGAEFFPNGNQVVCYDPMTGVAHENPAACARFVGGLVGEEFKGPGHGGQYFTEMGMIGKNGKRMTPADIMRGADRTNGACTDHAKP